MNSFRLFLPRLLILAVAFTMMLGTSAAIAQLPPEAQDMPGIPKIPGVTVPFKESKKIDAPVDVLYVKGWVSAAANDIFNFSASTYPEHRKNNGAFFTKKGFKSFYSEIEAGFLKAITEKDQKVRGYIISPVAVMEPKMVNTVIYWDVSFNYAMEYISKTGTSYQFLNVTVEIKDQSDQDGPRIGIDRWRATIDPDPVFCPCRDDGGPKRDETLGDTLKRRFDIEDEPEAESELEGTQYPDPMAPFYEGVTPHAGPMTETPE